MPKRESTKEHKPVKAPRSSAHVVSASIFVPELPKSTAGIILQVREHGKRLGTLTLGRGGIEWRGGRKRDAYTLSWTQFAGLLSSPYKGLRTLKALE